MRDVYDNEENGELCLLMSQMIVSKDEAMEWEWAIK